MSLIVSILVVILLLALAIYAVGLLPIEYKLGNLLRFALVVLALLYLVHLAGIA
jgi:hypothetical protein